MKRPLSASGIGAWRPYEPFLSRAMDDLDAAFGLAALLGHPWRRDPPHVAAALALAPAASSAFSAPPASGPRGAVAAATLEAVAVDEELAAGGSVAPAEDLWL